jgi:hypothetical protein
MVVRGSGKIRSGPIWQNLMFKQVRIAVVLLRQVNREDAEKGDSLSLWCSLLSYDAPHCTGDRGYRPLLYSRRVQSNPMALVREDMGVTVTNSELHNIYTQLSDRMITYVLDEDIGDGFPQRDKNL